MSIRLEHDKCWITDPESLQVKRYLSETRTYFREGSWIKTYFDAFFPNIKVGDEGNLYFDLTTLDPKCLTDSGVSLENTSIPEQLIDQLQIAVDDYLKRVDEKGLNFNEEVSSTEFTIPSPQSHPELYWVVETDEGIRLVILWGLESQRENANIKIDELCPILYENFLGKASIKKRSPKAKVKEPSASVVEKETESKPEPTPEIEKATEAKPPASEVVEKHTESDKVEATEEKTKPKKKDKATPSEVSKKQKSEKKKPGKASKPKKVATSVYSTPKGSKPSSGIFKKFIVTLVMVVVLALAITEASFAYLGSDINVSAQFANDETTNQIELARGQSVTLFDGSIVSAETGPKSVTIPRFPKPGKYRFEIKDESGEVSSISEISYNNSRNDMIDRPVASLLLNKTQLVVGENLEARVAASFHENPNESINSQISWGDGDKAFQPIANSNQILHHQFESPGEYNISLLSTDTSGLWDTDIVTVNVIESDAGLEANPIHIYQPIADAQVLSIVDIEGQTEITLDVSGTYDYDGTIKSVEIDWGDGSSEQKVSSLHTPIKHRFKKGKNKYSVSIIATDDSDTKSAEPCLIYIDLQSSQMNDIERFGQSVEPVGMRTIQIDESSATIDLQKTIFEQLVRNKERYQFSIVGNSNHSNTPLIDVVWKLKQTSTGEEFVVRSTPIFEVAAVDGIYQLSVEATTPTGDVVSNLHRFSVHTKNKIDPVSKAANWIKATFPYISISYYL